MYVKKLLSVAAGLLILLLCIAPVFAASGSKVIVDDAAGLFSAEEKAALEQAAKDAVDSTPLATTLCIVTTDYAQGKTAISYADDYFDSRYLDEGWPRDGLVYLIDMDNREIYISAAGAYQGILSLDRMDVILDTAYLRVSSGDYAASAEAFVDGFNRFCLPQSDGLYELAVDDVPIDLWLVSDMTVSSWSTSDANSYGKSRSDAFTVLYEQSSGTYYKIANSGQLEALDSYKEVFFPTPASRYLYTYGGSGIIGLIVGLIASAINKRAVTHSNRDKALADVDRGRRIKMNLTANTDTLMDVSRTRRFIPPPSNPGSSGGHSGSTRSSMHRSSRGVSHTGGGRRF